jgi:hypothetical protein
MPRIKTTPLVRVTLGLLFVYVCSMLALIAYKFAHTFIQHTRG